MAVNSDWLANSREGRAAMGKTWDTMLSGRKEEFSIPEDMIKELNEAQTNLNGMLTTPKNQRTPAYTITIYREDKRLVAIMREIKKRFIHIPPFKEEDIVTLGLKKKDTIPTEVSVPKVQPTAKINYKAAGLFELVISPAKVISADKRAYYGCKIIYELFSPTDSAPTDRKQLHESKFTRRKKEEFVFQSDDSGKRMYFCMRYENSKGAAGPWSPIISVVIP